ncbi:MAG: hypothetical protein JSV25_15675 [Spirochaetota bacterium]|nr:MAG: hypothetical protein JSV25_15675 [Spirochaetota bacterium]
MFLRLKHALIKVIIFTCGLLPFTSPIYADKSDNYVLVRSYYPTYEYLSYQNIYLYYRLRYSPLENMMMNISVVKGLREPGFYPLGYFAESTWGIYEKGSYNLLLKNYFNFKKIILGNYVPLFGQGILYGGIFPVILSNPYYDLARYRDGVYPTSSVSKTVLLEGLALEYLLGNVYIRPFLSWNSYDCTAGESTYYKYEDNDSDGIPNDEDEDDFTGIGPSFPTAYSCKNSIFSAICEEPDYEIESDRAKRNNLAEYLFGINISSHFDKIKVGGTLTYAFFNRLIDPYYNYDPDEGDKTGHYFRGKDYFASSIYFKIYEPIEIFGEMVGSYNQKLSYYPEFNGGYSSAFGFSGGIRKKIDHVGVIMWGACIPANLVNPHALELPDGRNNVLCGLFGINTAVRKQRYVGWIYAYRELNSEDYPLNPETGLSYHYKIEYPVDEAVSIKLDQNYEAIDSYYLAPALRSYKIKSKLSMKYKLEELDLQLSLENRWGGPQGEKMRTGTGIGGEVVHKRKELDASIQVIYYNTDDDKYAYIYPYQRSFAGWGFIAPSINGQGLTGAGILVKRFQNDLTVGTRVVYKLDFFDTSKNGLTIYLLSKVFF